MTHSYLLDTHTIIWWFTADRRLGKVCEDLLESSENQLFLSSASLHEFSIKDSLRRMPFSTSDLSNKCHEFHVQLLPFDWQAAEVLKTLPFHHKDPFDRALIAQAISSDLTLITSDVEIQKYIRSGVKLLSASL